MQPEAQEWLEIPFLNSKSTTAKGLRCVSWSGSNLIACTNVEGVYVSRGYVEYLILFFLSLPHKAPAYVDQELELSNPHNSCKYAP